MNTEPPAITPKEKTGAKAGPKHAWPRIRKRLNPSGKIGFRVDCGMVGDKRLVKQFATIAEAEEFAAEKRAEREAGKTAQRFEKVNRAVSLAKLNDAQRGDVLAAFRILDGTKGTLADAAAFWKKHAAPANAKTCAEVLADLVKACEGANRRPRTVSELREKLGAFCAEYGAEPIARVTSADLAAWLDGRADRTETRGEGKAARKVRVQLTPRSRAAYRQALNRLFAFAARRQYREGNPVLAIEKPSVETPPPEVHTPDEVRRVLAAAVEMAPALVPFYAVGYFAGLRTENELRGLDWSRINLKRKELEVNAATAKKRRSRYVPMAANLTDWLRPHQQDEGRIFYSRTQHEKVMEKAGVKWPRNVMRHSFASYHLAAYRDAGKTALALGHPHGVEVLFEHYRKLTRPTVAHAFWKIRPTPAAAGKVIPFAEAVA